jgi:hypothetical protein
VIFLFHAGGTHEILRCERIDILYHDFALGKRGGTDVSFPVETVKQLESEDFHQKKYLLFPEGKGILSALVE